MLVIPIDKAAPKGRLILPQQQTIRDILDHGATAIAVRDSELSETLKTLEEHRLLSSQTVRSLMPSPKSYQKRYR